MGYMRHHAIVVTSFSDEVIEAAYGYAMAVFSGTYAQVSEVTDAAMNGHRSFFVAPDGSKEGWTDSNAGDDARAALVAWMRDRPALDWVEVQFGDDERRTRIVSDSDQAARDDDGTDAE